MNGLASRRWSPTLTTYCSCIMLFSHPPFPSAAQVYFWLGSSKHKKSYPSGLPPGFQVTNELMNAERPGLPPPTSIHYTEKHVSRPETRRLCCVISHPGSLFPRWRYHAT